MITQNTITERAAQHLQDILNAAPNVTFAAGSSRSRFVQIRGIGDLEQYYDPKYYPSVGMMLDNLGLVLSGPLSNTLKGRIAVQQNNSDGYND